MLLGDDRDPLSHIDVTNDYDKEHTDTSTGIIDNGVSLQDPESEVRDGVDSDHFTDEGTNTDGSDSTYRPSESSSGESIDLSQTLEVESADFTFNLANTLGMGELQERVEPVGTNVNVQSPSGDSDTSASSSISSIDLFVPVADMIQRIQAESFTPSLEDSEAEPSGVQLFSKSESYDKELGVLFTQMSAHKGIKLFGERAVAAMFKELK